MNKDAKKILKITLLSIFFVFIIIFVFFNSRNLIFGVKIKNVNITDNMKATENIQKITGVAKNAIKISLNGREISIDQKGNFDETISLSVGYNLINIKAQDKFGNVDEKNYQLIY
ncbi:MAG: hypothetical protein WCG45_00655 [bacterium]